MTKVVLAGGGTGGHVYPALAIGAELRERGHELVYFGDPGRLEARVAPQHNIPFVPVHAKQYPRAGIMGKVRFAWSLFLGILDQRRALKQAGAQAVLGVGGYISAPTVLAGVSLGLPTAIHEANVVPGMANRLCARFAGHALLTYEQTARRLGGKAAPSVVGMPVGQQLRSGDREQAAAHYGLDPSRPTVVFVGGSLGATCINELAVRVARTGTTQVLHLCGPRYEDAVREAWGAELPPGYALVPYEDQMARAYALADLVVARSGSSTLAELTALGIPSLLIPSPHVTDNHQEGNARALEAEGAAVVVLESEAAQADDLVIDLMGDADRLTAMSKAAASMGHWDAAQQAADVLEASWGQG